MPHGTRWNTKKGLKPLLHQEDVIAHISRCMEQVKGKKKDHASRPWTLSTPYVQDRRKAICQHTYNIYIYIYTEPTNGKERSILDPSAPKWKDTSSNHTIDECY